MLDATVRALEAELREGDFVHRYGRRPAGQEGAFLICSFWLVDAFLFTGRHEEARALYERLLRHANDVGLFAEEIEPATGAFLGNFPQAFTHLALIQSAANPGLAAERGAAALEGCAADRMQRAVRATMGWRALWAAFRKSGRVGRLRSSAASVLHAP